MSVQEYQARRRWRSVVPISLLLVLVAGSGVAAWLSAGSPSSSVGPEGVQVFNVPDLANATSTRHGGVVDGITCRTQSKEVVRYHVHVLVTVYVNGAMRRLPAGVGITQPWFVTRYPSGVFDDVGVSNCLYWLHTHVADGIIHVEAPSRQTFTLGQFFDIWHQPLGPYQVGPDKGKVVVFENGRELVGNPRSTLLLPHGVIQLDVGSPIVAFQPRRYRVTGGCGEGTTGCSAPVS